MSLLHQMRLDNPVGLWPLNETSGATAYDVSGNGFHGTYTGNATTVADSLFGRAATFDGADDYINIPHAALLGSMSAVTLEIWCWTAATSGFQGLISKTVSNAAGPYDWYIENVTRRSNGIVGAGGAGFGGLANSVAPINRWIQLAWSYGAGTMTHYLDGNPDGSLGGGGSLGDAGAAVKIGNRGDLFTDMVGRLAYAAVYPSALSASRIKAHHEAGMRQQVIL